MLLKNFTIKKNLPITITFLVLFLSFANAQNTAIPDTIFEDYLETHAADGTIVSLGDDNSMGDGIANNGLVLTDRISTVTLLNVSDLGIVDLTGLEDFVDLETLFCNDNNLSTLNIGSNTNLVSLICGSNNLSELVLSSNPILESLNCSDNQIQVLDLSNNNALESIIASGNQLSVIDVSNMESLTTLGVSNNRIVGELVISNNPNLEGLFCSSNKISIIDVSQNKVLKNLDASNNVLTSLDLRTINSVVCPDPQTDPVTLCQGSASINVSRNQLTSLVVNNGFNDLITLFNSTNNPDLFCIQIDAGFEPYNWVKDDWTYYSPDTCLDIFTYVPDDNFEQTLIDLGYDDVLDNLVLRESISGILNLNISNASIVSLVGIEDFLALTSLDCSFNAIESIDLSKNIALLELNISNNELSNLETALNLNLTVLNCSSNALETIDVFSNIELTQLNCSSNTLPKLDLSNNVLLVDLDCSFNDIESLNLVANASLTSLLCNDNNLFTLRIDNGNNTIIDTLNATNNINLFCVDVDNVAFADGNLQWQKDGTASYNTNCGTYVPDDNFEQALIDLGIDSDNTLNNFVPTTDISALATPLDISGLGITDLTGIQDFLALRDLNCSNNNISVLNLSANAELQNLNCSNNRIENLDLTTNSALLSVFCSNNMLSTLDLANGFNNAIADFNATNNTTLFCINVDTAILGNIPANWQIEPFADYNDDCTSGRFTDIPDPVFEQVLIDLNYDDAIDGRVLTSSIEQAQTLNVSNKGILNLDGIQDFKSLIELDCSSNFLDELNVSDMLFLERLNCSSNFLLTNDSSAVNGVFNTLGTINLKELYCSSNNLTNLNTAINSNLEILDCSENNLIDLNVANNTFLKNLNCSNNDLNSLDISNNANLVSLNCNSNNLETLITPSVSNITLENFSCANNELSELILNNYQGLTRLNCSSNALMTINIEGNLELVFLAMTNNDISEINLLNNTELEEVQLAQNNLSELILTANVLLENLNCAFNDITEIDLNSNPLIKYLDCSNNQLETLDVSNNTSLIETNASSNTISNLVLSNNLGTLKTLNISSNVIEGDIDLTTMAIVACVAQSNQTEFCPDEISINLSNNLFDFVNIQNGLNADIDNFNALNNLNLDCIQVDDPNSIAVNWLKDETATYKQDCNFGETFVPDDNFEQALIDLGLDSGPLNNYVLTSDIEGLTNLDVSGKVISNLTGIEDFVALIDLNVSNNALTEIDISSNVSLAVLNCADNLLTTLNVENNTALAQLDCSGNTMSSIIGISSTILSEIDLSSNAFTTFVPSELPLLKDFNGNNNALVELNFQQNFLLVSISCQSNELETLNIKNGQNSILNALNAENNPNLICIETDDGTVPNGSTWNIDSSAQFAINCFFGQTFVPDDNFEQALIDLGYDTGTLDDYVVTANIEDVNFLNLAGLEISELTGIEAFINLTSLDFSQNMISIIDLSRNVLLVNLNASGNLLTNLNLASLFNLTRLSVSANNLSDLNLEANPAIIELDVSINSIENLVTENLQILEELNCASNNLESLDVTQNPNLTLLFCQSNLFIADQLNLQNGNNQNLQQFNASNNPDLACILVDNPVAVITNTDGIYNNWIKDSTASYQTICEDADNDGIPNVDDLCPTTEFGATVDLFGCAIIDLPNDNFNILVTGETCLNSNNGKITIVAQELYNYTATLIGETIFDGTGEVFYQEYNFTNDVDIFNLLADTYQMCITIEEWPDYQICYAIVITQPNPLEVFSSRIASGDYLSVNMTGSLNYNIEFNGETFTTYNPIVTLDLKQGLNTLKISTDLACQGIYEEEIYVSDSALVFPNPFNDEINIFTENENDEVSVKMYSMIGQLVLNKSLKAQSNSIKLNSSELGAGMYMMIIQSKTLNSTYKIIKE